MGRRTRRIGLIGLLLACGGPVASAPGSHASTDTTDGVGASAALVPVGPVRLADTRRPACGCRRISATTITVDVTARPDVPDDAVAAAVTITALRTADAGYVTAYPAGIELPGTSTVNTRPDRVASNTAIVPLGDDGRLAVFASGRGDVVVDLAAVFVPADRARAGRFVPVDGRRLVDTRSGPSPGGALAPGDELNVPLPAGVAHDATAVLVNITNLRESRPGHLTVQPAGTPPTRTSVLNPNGSGAPVAAAAIVPVTAAGLTITSTSGGHVAVDLLGWFTGPTAAEAADGLYVPALPRRLLDTRSVPGRIHPGGAIELPSPYPAAALVTNVTAVRPDRRGFVTAYPAGRPVPGTSTVNPAAWNDTVANFAVTRTSSRGIAHRSSGGTDLVVDVSGWFTGHPAVATEPVPRNVPARARVLVVGDSTLASLDVVTAARSAFVGFDVVVDAASCRRLLRPSCLSNVTGLVPNTAVEAIAGTPGSFDVVVVKAGYNDWFSDFPTEFDAVVRTARGKGAHTIVWLSYNEDVAGPNARRAYAENNVDLRRLVTLPRYADVLLADWMEYSRPRPDWFTDGTHATAAGAWSLADYVSRWIAAVEHRPCPRPWALGAATPDPCPAPDRVGPVGDARSLY